MTIMHLPIVRLYVRAQNGGEMQSRMLKRQVSSRLFAIDILTRLGVKSIKIQPSAIALVAKSLALIGDRKTFDGYRACDNAIAQSASSDAQFLRVIKVSTSLFCIFMATHLSN